MDDEEGATHVLEAVIFAILMLMSVAFVVTFEVPTTQNESFLTHLDDIAQSSLDAWAGTPPQDPDSPFPTRLEQYVAEALMGDDANLTEYLHLVVPLGSMYRLTLETGNGTIHVAGEEQPPPLTYPRIVASRETRLRPSGTFLQTEFGIQDGLHPLRPMAVTIENGRILDPGGVPLEVRVTYTNGSAPRTHATVHYTSRNPGAPVPSASLYFVDEDDEPIGSAALAADGVFQGQLVLTESSDAAPVPAGTVLTLRVPTGWTDVECDDEANAAWSRCSVEIPDELGGGTITAELLAAVRNRAVSFHFTAHYADQGPTRLPFSPWRAELSGHNGATAELLAAPADNHLTQPATPMVGVTLPNPMGEEGPSQLLVSVGNGRVAEIYVQRIEIEPLDGSSLFATADGDGWSASAGILVWAGNKRVLPRAAHDFGAEVRANRVNATGSFAQETVPLEFDDDFRVDLSHWRHEGVRKDDVPAPTLKSPGYPNIPGSHWMHTRDGPRGNLTINVTPLPESSLMSNLYDAHVTSRLDVNRKQATPGQTVTLTADFTGVLETLVDHGNLGDRNVAVTTNVYSPVSFLRKVPWMTFEANEETLGHPPIWFTEFADANHDGTKDLLLAKGSAVYAFDGRFSDYDARLWKRTYAANTNALLALVDADGDGEAEAVVVTANGRVELLNLATGGVEQAFDLYQGVTAAAVGGDCDEDGRPELLVGSVKATGQTTHDGPTFVGLDDLDLGAAQNANGWLHVVESDGARLLPRESIDLGTATKVRDFTNGTLTAENVCAFVTAEANGDVTAYDGAAYEELWTHESGVPYERGGATQVVIMETDPPGHPSYGVPEVVYGDGDGWVTSLNSTRPAPVPMVLDLSGLLGGDKLVDVDMVSQDVGYAISRNGLVFKTTEGWATVLTVPSSLVGELAATRTTVEAFDFYDNDTGILATAKHMLYFTDNGGATFTLDEAREMPGPTKELQFYALDAAVAAVDDSDGLIEIQRNAGDFIQYHNWSGVASSLWIASSGGAFVVGPHGSVARFRAGDRNSVEFIPMGSDRNLVSILRFGDEPAATDDDGHIFHYDSAADSWTMKNLTSSPELNLTWLASSTDANLHMFNVDGGRGYGLADRSSGLGPYRTQVSLDEPFVGVSRGVDGPVAAATETKIIALHEPTAERRWSFPAVGSVESLEATTGGIVGTARLGAFHVEPVLGNGLVLTPLHAESLANFGRLRWMGSDFGWVAGTYLVGDGSVPIPIEPLPERTPLTLQSNLVERYNATSQLVWTRPLPQENDADSLAFALSDYVLVGQRGGSLAKLLLHDGNQGGSSYPGDLTGKVVMPLHLPGQLLYGPYIAESQLRLRMADAGAEVIQSATIVNQFEVTPNGGPWSPRLYTLHLLVWPTV